MIETIADDVSGKNDVSKEVASKGLENTSPFTDSARPTDGNMELPKLKDSDQLSETKQFNDSDRPSDSSGIEQPRLKAIDTKENNPSWIDTNSSVGTDDGTKVKECLTDEQKQRIKEETGWSDEIIDAIGSWQEYEIYKNAGLVEAEIGGKKCLIRNDIDWNQLDEKGKTNAQRVKEGKAPLDKNGEQIQLHHIGQRADSPLAELTFDEHRRGGNDSILHDKTKETEVHGAGKENAWKAERESYWKARAEYNNEGNA